MPAQHPITNETEAITRASRLTELDTLTKKIRAQRVTVKNDRTPFLWKRINGRQAWQVDFDNVSLRLKSSIPNYPDKYTRRFAVLLDAGTAQLLSVAATFEGEDPDLRPPPPGTAAESQLNGQSETYHGLPSSDPKLTFLAALNLVLNHGIGSPFLAKEIYGSYVLHSRMGGPQLAAWVIELRGLPPIPVDGPHGDKVPIWQRNHMRNVIDDEMGKVLFATNSPQPE
jgi:hypothetical protein